MGIKFNCPNGHKLNVKSFLAGRRGICPQCDARFRIPMESGGVAEVIHKGDRGGEATPITDAMQDDYPAAGIPAGFNVAVASYEPNFGSPLGSPASGVTSGVSPVASPMASYATTTTDPLSEDASAAWYVRPRSGGQYGPAVGDILRDWIAEGRVAGDSLVWREGWADWRQASSVFPQLAGLLAGPTYPAMPGPVVAQATAAPAASMGVPVGSVAAAGNAAPIGMAAPVLSALPSSGISGAFAAPSPGSQPGNPVTKKAELRRRSGSFTAVVVVILVVVSIIMVGIFAWVIFGRRQAPTAKRVASVACSIARDLPRQS